MTTEFYIPEDLIQALIKDQVHFFIGSGVSRASEIPGWNEIINKMKKVIRDENYKISPEELELFLKNSDYLDIAEYFKDAVGEHRYFQFLREHFWREVPISPLHITLKKFPICTIFTTNYDKLLEKTFRFEHGDDPPIIIFPEQLGYIEESEIKIIKLHGDIDHPSTIVLTRSDYRKYERTHNDFVDKLRHCINNYTILFVGFGLQDPNFKRIYDDARNLFDTTKHRAYALMTGTNAIQREIWEKEDLMILPVSNHEEIPSYLDAILEKYQMR